MKFTMTTAIAIFAAVPVLAQSSQCKLSPSDVTITQPGVMPANLDGTCLAPSACSADGGETPGGSGGCTNGAQCCIKNNCNGPNSACLNPSLSGDTLPSGERGQFVSGSCPTGLRCFEITSGASSSTSSSSGSSSGTESSSGSASESSAAAGDGSEGGFGGFGGRGRGGRSGRFGRK